jgi:hypothetical protein
MCSGMLQCFITQSELTSAVEHIRQQDKLYLVLAYFWSTMPVKAIAPVQPWVSEPFPHAMFLSPVVATVDGLSFNDLAAPSYEEGWIYILSGLYEDNTLYLTDVAFKSPSADARRLFQRIKRHLRKDLTAGVRLTGPDDSDGRVLQDVYYSPGAKELYENGVLWRQRGLPISYFAPA